MRSVSGFGIFTLLVLLAFGNPLLAQKKRNLDIRQTRNDTLDIYRRIQKSAYKRRITKLLFQAVFVDPAPLKYEKKQLSDQQVQTDPNLKYTGRIIRSIEITVLDPFGYTANDTVFEPINPLQKAANKLHVKTLIRVVDNRLLFRKNQPVEVLKIKESERLLREAGFIRDARIFLTDGGTDSVDVVILVHDKWTLDPTVTVNSVRSGNIRLRDRNLLGLGHSFEQNQGYVQDGYRLSGNYNFSNIRNTYLSADLFYMHTQALTTAGVMASRPFYSVITRYAGGLYFKKSWDTYRLYDPSLQTTRSGSADYTDLDLWMAKSFSPWGNSSLSRSSSKIISGLRYNSHTLQISPPGNLDTAGMYRNRQMLMGSVGYTLRKYYKDQFIFRFGANEDIPEGRMFRIMYGITGVEGQLRRNYAGLEISEGKHLSGIGYFSAYLAYGTYFAQSTLPDATLRAGFFYFSDLSLERRWYIRQFIHGKLVKGFQKPNQERITISTSEMYGFNSGSALGSGKMLLNFETVAYAPYNLIGFKFAPVAFIGLGMLHSDQRTLIQTPVYQAYSLGMLIRNESLLNSSFEFTFGFYPNQPDHAGPAFRLNPITGFTLKIRSFEINRPETVTFD